MDFSLSSIRSIFTPTVLFLLLNLIIGTIAVISTLFRQRHNHNSAASSSGVAGGAGTLARSSSSNLFGLVRSSSLFRFRSGDLPPIDDSAPSQQPLTQDGGGGGGGGTTLARSSSSNVIDLMRSIGLFRFKSGDLPPMDQESTVDGVDRSQNQDQQFRRIRSESDKQSKSKEKEEIKEVKSKMKKSVSAMTTSWKLPGRSEAERRPAAAAPSVLRREASVDAEVDAKADDFINRFKQQLKLQRLDSILRYKEMLTNSN